MKKLLTGLLIAGVSLSASAEKYYVYSGHELAAGETSMGVHADVWNWEAGYTSESNNESTKVLNFHSNWGWAQFAMVADNFDTPKLQSANLTFNFSIMTASAGNVEIAMRVRDNKGGEEHKESRKTLSFPHDGLWHKMSFKVSEVFPEFYNAFGEVNTLDTPYFTITEQPGGSMVSVTEMYFDTEASETPLVSIDGVSEITETTAKLAYSATLPAGATDVKYYLNNVLITDNPYTITNLTAGTEYTYTLKVECKVNGRTVSGEDSVKFKTEAPPRTDALNYHLVIDGIARNATYDGVKQNLPLSLECTLGYNVDKTITVDMLVHGRLPEGLGVKWTFSGFDKVAMDKLSDNHFRINTGEKTYEEGEVIQWIYAMVTYDGNSNGDETSFAWSRGQDKNYPGGETPYKAGDVNDAIEYGEATDVEPTLDIEEEMQVGSTQYISIPYYGVDANGHYVFGESISVNITCESTGGENLAFTYDADESMLYCHNRGNATITMTSGEKSVSKEVKCVLSSWSKNIFEGGVYDEATNTLKVGEDEFVINHDARNNSIKYAFDGEETNDGHCITWNFSGSNDPEEDNHYLEIVFKKPYKIERFSILWDGASVYDYYVYLYGVEGEPESEALRLQPREDDGNIVWQGEEKDLPTGTGSIKVWHHLATNSVDESGNELNEGVLASKMRLVPVRAYNHSWGVKLQELQLLGSNDKIATGISNNLLEEDANAEVEYYNLQGVRVNRPSNGIFIRRCGNKSEKIRL